MSAGEVVIKLAKPVKAHGEEVLQLTLREPTVEDQMDLGTPFLIIAGDGETGIKIQPKVIAAYVVRLAAVPLSTVKHLSMNEFQLCQAAVLGFFGKGEDESTNSSSEQSST